MASKPVVAVRADSSHQIGSGHVTRCLTLADELRQRGKDVFFICCELPGNISTLIENRGYGVLRFEPAPTGQMAAWEYDAQQTGFILTKQSWWPVWLIVDHYALDHKWESKIRSWVSKIMVIDDLANRPHDCDLLLDQTFGQDRERYEGLISERCQALCGTSYTLLRPEFAQIRNSGSQYDRLDEKPVIHVFFGRMDHANYTARFARLLLTEFRRVKIKILVGSGYQGTGELRELSKDFGGRIRWDQEVTNVAAHMAECTLAFGAPGMATWERACLGLPAAYLAVAENQAVILESLSKKGFCYYLGSAESISDQELVYRFGEFLDNMRQLRSIREVCLANVDGKGTERVVATLIGNESI